MASHAELVDRAVRWLRNTRGCYVVLREPHAWSEKPDAIGWRYGGRLSLVIECKASRADFLADKHKRWRKPTHRGALGTDRFYMTVAGLVQPDEVPEPWGLLWVSGRRVSVKKPATHLQSSVLCADRLISEMAIVLSDASLVQIVRAGGKLLPTRRGLEIMRAVNGEVEAEQVDQH